MENQRNYDKSVYRVKKQLEFLSKSADQTKIHPKIDIIIKEISNTKFRDTVIGPIGNYIKIKDQKWAKVVSILTQNCLTNYICFDSQDRETLHSIFKRHNVSFSVQMPSNKMNKLIDYKRNENFNTLLDSISVSSTIVMNQLIIMLSIERIVLMTSREKAYAAMKESARYVDSIYLPNGDFIKKIGGSLSDFSSKKMERYYFENATDKRNELQRELKDLYDNKPSLVHLHEYEKMKNEMKDIELERDVLQRKISKINHEIENAEEMFAYTKRDDVK
ncbi:RAD18-like recombination AND DNA repair protein [Nosema bombycis CQ1]|uniref:RAD18-like recombination AND DNA repair protein n=1 Tax=Nosema bombycis (strain CQ1 / CVCC 102059) TaxID=578461 RepID=R0MJS9_NOSB1|nr:RAD18-like recombination AND DNA repair protein [Nosema bombycis CQ1]|eukprot:EOB14475.1 RAD18-like recombination AND DNA repair protein [Nosema bombycis CQ1]